MKNKRLTGPSDGITTPDGTTNPLRLRRRAVALLHFLFKKKSYSYHSCQELLDAMVVPSHRLQLPSVINHAMLSFDWRFSYCLSICPLFSCLTGSTLAYTNISLSEIRKQHIKMRSCYFQKEMSGALIHIFYDYKSYNVYQKVWLG